MKRNVLLIIGAIVVCLLPYLSSCSDDEKDTSSCNCEQGVSVELNKCEGTVVYHNNTGLWVIKVVEADRIDGASYYWVSNLNDKWKQDGKEVIFSGSAVKATVDYKSDKKDNVTVVSGEDFFCLNLTEISEQK